MLSSLGCFTRMRPVTVAAAPSRVLPVTLAKEDQLDPVRPYKRQKSETDFTMAESCEDTTRSPQLLSVAPMYANQPTVCALAAMCICIGKQTIRETMAIKNLTWKQAQAESILGKVTMPQGINVGPHRFCMQRSFAVCLDSPILC